MAVQRFILKHWNKQQGVFLQNLELLRSKEQAVAVHDFRVAIKKLRSYLKLLEKLGKISVDDLRMEKTEALFSVLGKHRDIDTSLSLITINETGGNSYKAMKDQLMFARRKAWERSKKSLRNYKEVELTDLTKHINDVLKNADTDDLIRCTQSIIENELRDITRSSNHLAKHAHAVRKHLKDIYYGSLLEPAAIFLKKEKQKSIKKALDSLGDWQDHEMLRRKVKHFRRDFIPSRTEEFKLLKELEKSISGKMESLITQASQYLSVIDA